MIGAAVFGENAAQDAASETASYEVHLGLAALRVASPRRLGRRTSTHAVADVASKERRGSAAAAPARAGEFLTGRTPTARARVSSYEDFWQILYSAGVDVILAGHLHT
jgi:hypothetical protein